MDIYIALVFAVIYTLGAAYTDLRTRRIPNIYTFSALGLALIMRIALATVHQDIQILYDGLLGFAVGFGILFIAFALRMAGAGDVKMLATLGMTLGLHYFAWVFILAGILDFVLLFWGYVYTSLEFWLQPAIPIQLKREGLRFYLQNKRPQKNPYALPVALASICVIILYHFGLIEGFAQLYESSH